MKNLYLNVVSNMVAMVVTGYELSGMLLLVVLPYATLLKTAAMLCSKLILSKNCSVFSSSFAHPLTLFPPSTANDNVKNSALSKIDFRLLAHIREYRHTNNLHDTDNAKLKAKLQSSNKRSQTFLGSNCCSLSSDSRQLFFTVKASCFVALMSSSLDVQASKPTRRRCWHSSPCLPWQRFERLVSSQPLKRHSIVSNRLGSWRRSNVFSDVERAEQLLVAIL